MKKDSLLKGTLVLAAAALVARALGLFQRVPIEHVLGDQGNIYYGVANNVYLFLLVVATAGIPSAVSKMVSERYALGREDEARQVYRVAMLFGAAAGITVTMVMLGLAPLIAGTIMDEPGAAASIRAIAPSLLLFPMIAMMRGYFQGRRFMTAGAISQIYEQILRVAAAIALAFSFAAWGWSDEKIAAGASFGSVFGSVGAFLVMLYFSRKLKREDRAAKLAYAPAGQKRLSARAIFRELLRLSMPVIVTASTVQLLYTLDSIMIKPLLAGHFEPETIYMWGSVLVQRAQSIAGIPVILAVAMGQSIIPVISSLYASRDREKTGQQASLALRVALFSAMPIILVLSVGAYSVNGLIFSSDEGSAIVALLTCGTLFQIGMMITNSILLGIGQPIKATKHAVTGILLKIVLSFALAPWLGVYGLIVATSCCFIWTLFFNLLSLKKRTSFQLLARDRWSGFLAATIVCAAVIGGVQWGVLGLLAALPAKLAMLIAAMLMGAAAIGTFPALLVLMKVIRPGETDMYPKPVRKLLAPLFRLQRVRGGGSAHTD